MSAVSDLISELEVNADFNALTEAQQLVVMDSALQQVADLYNDAAKNTFMRNTLEGASGISAQANILKLPVRVATTAVLAANTYADGVLTADANGAIGAIDGKTLVANDRILVKNEVDGKKHGVYVVTQVGSASLPYILTRAEDANSDAKMVSAVLVTVEDGTANGGTVWILDTANPVTLGTTSLTFTQIGAAGATYVDVPIIFQMNQTTFGTSITRYFKLDGVQIDPGTPSNIRYALFSVQAGFLRDLRVLHLGSASATNCQVTVQKVASFAAGVPSLTDTTLTINAPGVVQTNYPGSGWVATTTESVTTANNELYAVKVVTGANGGAAVDTFAVRITNRISLQ